MAPEAVLVLLIVIGLPIGWFVSEFSDARVLRICLGAASIASTIGVAYLVGHLSHFTYNAWYGDASKALVETVLEEIEDGNTERVVGVLRGLDLEYQPTYENRAHYDELVRAAVVQMRGEGDVGSHEWGAQSFDREIWSGYWESDTDGGWVLASGSELRAFQVANGVQELRDVEFSADFRTLTFADAKGWQHRWTLVNKYEAIHWWNAGGEDDIEMVETMHKLVRATPGLKVSPQQLNH